MDGFALGFAEPQKRRKRKGARLGAEVTTKGDLWRDVRNGSVLARAPNGRWVGVYRKQGKWIPDEAFDGKTMPASSWKEFEEWVVPWREGIGVREMKELRVNKAAWRRSIV